MKKPTLHTWRRVVQIFIALAFIVIPIVNRNDYSFVYGNYLSLHLFGIPVSDPLAVLQLAVKNLYLTPVNIIGALIPLLLAFFLGTIFCSWLCAFGLLSELTHTLSGKLFKHPYRGLPESPRGFYCKFGVFALGLIVFFTFSFTPILNQLSMPAWYSRFFQYLFGQDTFSLCIFFLLALLTLECVTGKRLWCRYVCPQSVLLVLARQINRNRMRVAFAREKCICRTGRERCGMSCHLQLNPKQVHIARERECSNCGDCVVACAKMGKALSFEWETGRLISGWFSGAGRRMVVKKGALVLLAILLVGGSGFLVVRFGPNIDFSPTRSLSIKSPLSEHKFVWNCDDPTAAAAEAYEFLGDGTLICTGGDWPQEGFKGWRWQPLGDGGSFTILQEGSMPGFSLAATMQGPLQAGTSFIMEPLKEGKPVGAGTACVLKAVEPLELEESHLESATEMDARVTISRYAGEVYIQDLLVLDPGGKKIKKILSEGDLITTEGMLTAVHRWINSPVIYAAEGGPPLYPVHTRMELRFRDNRPVERLSFLTTTSKDRSGEEFEDLWY